MPDAIQSLELFQVPPRWVFLKMVTSEGIVGWGEPVVEGKAASVVSTVMDMQDLLIGADPDRIEDLYQVLYRGNFYRHGPILMSAISGIEQALWDIKGKRLGVPVYQLLGGACRTHIQAYCWVGGDEPQQTAEAALARAEAGWQAVKMNGVAKTRWLETPASINRIIKEIALVREAVGWDLGIAVDFHGRVRRALAPTLLRELEPLKPLFVEEPTLPEHVDYLERLAAFTTIPLATGERLIGRRDFAHLLQKQSVAIIQPDLSHAGGIWEVRKIAAMAENSDIAVAPHCPLGPIALAASLQLDFCTPNAVLQEAGLNIHYNQASGYELTDYVTNGKCFQLCEGYFEICDQPGLGIEIDEQVVHRASSCATHWRNPIWRYSDGSFAEW